MSFFDAWRLWFAGQKLPEDFEVWGIGLLLLGRLGKLAQFVGGTTVLLDLLGPERLRAWGNRVRGSDQPFLRNLKKLLSGVHTLPLQLGYVILLANMAKSEPAFVQDPEKREAARELRQRQEVLHRRYPVSALDWRAYVLVGTFGGVAFFLVLFRYEPYLGWLQGLPGILALPMLLAPLPIGFYACTVLSALLVSAARYGIDVFVARPLARVFDMGHPGLPLRWAGFLLIVVGFQFDLLAS